MATIASSVTNAIANTSPTLLTGYAILALIVLSQLSYLVVYIVAPTPRPTHPSEKTYKHIEDNGSISYTKPLPCWKDVFDHHRRRRKQSLGNKEGEQQQQQQLVGGGAEGGGEGEEAECYMSLVVPAFNEEERLGIMLREAVGYLMREYGGAGGEGRDGDGDGVLANGDLKHRRKSSTQGLSNGYARARDGDKGVRPTGWEVLVVSDGSKDKTVDTALEFARSLGKESAGLIRVVSLVKNRGKGGAVTHGLRHVRGKYAVFADADGASKFDDLGKLVRELQKIEDKDGRGVAVGSRAHLVGSEEVVKRSFLRNLLMHSFHLLLWALTPPATAAIRDTQCGFKIFSRAALPYIVPYMHSESWIFDVEMLMLAEAAAIPVAEVPIGWHEVQGSKLNVIWDSLGMAWGLFILRAAWAMGVYRRT
ncbi:MAG: hypothetical protein LQ350_008123 [Teloschistes chrysophthalmus]|nr:MAG: hypothetical protein LQ350_008123 [Niorma chrysophthalma]